MPKRKIVEIDQSKCDGCGQCVLACAEGAIQIIDGKARLVSDVYCDGLGACLGRCPQDAIRIVERDAPPFDPEAVDRHLAARAACDAVARRSGPSADKTLPDYAGSGCPGLAVMSLDQRAAGVPGAAEREASARPAALGNWPIQLKLVPTHAPYLQGANLLLGADCVPFALGAFHPRFLQGRVLLVGCPKLDDAQFYVEKLAAILQTARPRSLSVVHMEVPCCTGLVRIAQAALQAAGNDLPLHQTTVSIRGQLLGLRSPNVPVF